MSSPRVFWEDSIAACAGKRNQLSCVLVLKAARAEVQAYVDNEYKGHRYICHALEAVMGLYADPWLTRVEAMLQAPAGKVLGGERETVAEWLALAGVDMGYVMGCKGDPAMLSRLAWLDHLILVEEIGAPVHGPKSASQFPGSIDFPFHDPTHALPFHLYFEEALCKI